jgi:hypothetical protein
MGLIEDIYNFLFPKGTKPHAIRKVVTEEAESKQIQKNEQNKTDSKEA